MAVCCPLLLLLQQSSLLMASSRTAPGPARQAQSASFSNSQDRDDMIQNCSVLFPVQMRNSLPSKRVSFFCIHLLSCARECTLNNEHTALLCNICFSVSFYFCIKLCFCSVYDNCFVELVFSSLYPFFQPQLFCSFSQSIFSLPLTNSVTQHIAQRQQPSIY